MGECLDECLASPSVLKVMHGARNDAKWLQRDFDLHLVNVFDTEQACKALRKRKSALRGLLSEYFGAFYARRVKRLTPALACVAPPRTVAATSATPP